MRGRMVDATASDAVLDDKPTGKTAMDGQLSTSELPIALNLTLMTPTPAYAGSGSSVSTGIRLTMATMSSALNGSSTVANTAPLRTR